MLTSNLTADERKAAFLYRTNPKLPRQIERRRNVRCAKWEKFDWKDTAEEARQEVIRLSKGEQPK